jgi:hypothetical protein
MCEPGKVGIWLTPEEAKVIVSTLRLLSSRIEDGAVDHLRRLMLELEEATRLDAQRREPDEPDEDEDEEPEGDTEETELIPILDLPAEPERERTLT